MTTPRWARPRGRGRCRGRASAPVNYLTEAEAQAAAIRVSRFLGPMRAYRCDRCRLWHLTTWRTETGT